jgi:hypothetical protein
MYMHYIHASVHKLECMLYPHFLILFTHCPYGVTHTHMLLLLLFALYYIFLLENMQNVTYP